MLETRSPRPPMGKKAPWNTRIVMMVRMVLGTMYFLRNNCLLNGQLTRIRRGGRAKRHVLWLRCFNLRIGPTFVSLANRATFWRNGEHLVTLLRTIMPSLRSVVRICRIRPMILRMVIGGIFLRTILVPRVKNFLSKLGKRFPILLGNRRLVCFLFD